MTGVLFVVLNQTPRGAGGDGKRSSPLLLSKATADAIMKLVRKLPEHGAAQKEESTMELKRHGQTMTHTLTVTGTKKDYHVTIAEAGKPPEVVTVFTARHSGYKPRPHRVPTYGEAVEMAEPRPREVPATSSFRG